MSKICYYIGMVALVCVSCRKTLTKSWQRKYCSNQCQADERYTKFKTLWIDAHKKVSTVNISRHIKRYLIETYGEKCSECGWNKKHPITARVPIEVDHKNGDANDNVPSNIRLLCPNCHALTASFRNLNKGKGRSRRRINTV